MLEHKDRRESFRLQDTYAFRLLQGQVTNEAIRLIRDEWEVVKSDYRRFGQLDEDYQRHGPLEKSQVIARTINMVAIQHKATATFLFDMASHVVIGWRRLYKTRRRYH